MLRHRRLGLGQESTGQRHLRRRRRQRDLNQAKLPPRRARRHRRPRADRQDDRHRPVADRPHAAFQPGDLHQALRRHPPACSRSSRRPSAAATSPAGSASTSRAAAARPARGTARTGSRWTSCADVWVTCPVCEGKRFNRETLQVRFKGKSIADVLEMDVAEAARASSRTCRKIAGELQHAARRRPRLHQARPAVADALRAARRSGSSWPASWSKSATGKTLYLLDEPTTGLHFADVQRLLDVLARLRRRRQHGGRDRAQPRRDQDRRLDDRPRARGR